MKRVQRLLREPLLHFMVLGGLIFVLFAAVSEPAPAPIELVVIGPDRIEQLSRSYEAAWQHPPSAEELDGIIEDAVREEVYYREAVALGLDTNDTIVRRRMRQKMEFLTDSGAELLEPVAGELEAHLLANEAKFQRGPRLAFEQIFLGQRPDRESTRLLMRALQSGDVADPSTLGEATRLPAQVALSEPKAVDGIFGQAFFDRLAELPPGAWTGPVASGYGAHLVRISESLPVRTPALGDVREAVLRDWKEMKARDLRELYYAGLREQYVVEIRRTDPEATQD